MHYNAMANTSSARRLPNMAYRSTPTHVTTLRRVFPRCCMAQGHAHWAKRMVMQRMNAYALKTCVVRRLPSRVRWWSCCVMARHLMCDHTHSTYGHPVPALPRGTGEGKEKSRSLHSLPCLRGRVREGAFWCSTTHVVRCVTHAFIALLLSVAVITCIDAAELSSKRKVI